MRFRNAGLEPLVLVSRSGCFGSELFAVRTVDRLSDRLFVPRSNVAFSFPTARNNEINVRHLRQGPEADYAFRNVTGRQPADIGLERPAARDADNSDDQVSIH